MSGDYTYICKDCGEKQILSRADRASKFRPRCRFCGSLHLEPVKKKLVETRIDLHTVARRIAQGKSSTVPFNKKRNKK